MKVGVVVKRTREQQMPNVHSASTESRSRSSASAVFYKAACRLSGVRQYGLRDSPYEFSCHAVSLSEVGSIDWSPCRETYENLMEPSHGWLSPSDVSFAAESVDWSEQDYRTFMLLMVAEAVK